MAEQSVDYKVIKKRAKEIYMECQRDGYTLADYSTLLRLSKLLEQDAIRERDAQFNDVLLSELCLELPQRMQEPEVTTKERLIDSLNRSKEAFELELQKLFQQ